MLRTVMIWLLLIVIVGIPTLITIFATTLVFMEEIEKEEMALLDKNAEEETCFRQPKTLKTPELQLGNSRSEIQLVD